MSDSETPALKAERERREEQDSQWNKAREVAQTIIRTEGKDRWIPTSEFTHRVSLEASVERSIALSIIIELTDNGEAVYELGNGYRSPESSYFADTVEPVEREADVARRANFLAFVSLLNRIHGK